MLCIYYTIYTFYTFITLQLYLLLIYFLILLYEEEQKFIKWWISSFEHLKACGGGISDDMEIKLQEMKKR